MSQMPSNLDALVSERLRARQQPTPAAGGGLDALVAERIAARRQPVAQDESGGLRVGGVSDFARGWDRSIMGLGSAGVGVAGTALSLNPATAAMAPGFQQYARQFAEANAARQAALGPDSGTIAETIGGAAPQFIGATGAGMLTGGLGVPAAVGAFAATSAAPVVGQTFQDATLAGQSAPMAGLEAAGAGAITAGTSYLPGAAILSKTPIGGQLLQRIQQNVIGRLGMAATAEMVQEATEGAAQDVLAIGMREGRLPSDEEWSGIIDRATDPRQAIASGLLGGGARGAVEIARAPEPGTGAQSRRSVPQEPQSPSWADVSRSLGEQQASDVRMGESIQAISGADQQGVMEAVQGLARASDPNAQSPEGTPTQSPDTGQAAARRVPASTVGMAQNPAAPEAVPGSDTLVGPTLETGRAASPQSTREPWQMTRREYLNRRLPGETDEEYAKAQAVPVADRDRMFGGSHRVSVRDALASGKPVPPEVLADYPDLAARAPREATRGGEIPVSPLIGERARARAQNPPTEVPDFAVDVARDRAEARRNSDTNADTTPAQQTQTVPTPAPRTTVEELRASKAKVESRQGKVYANNMERQAARLLSGVGDELHEYRSAGYVTRSGDGKYTLHVVGGTDGPPSKWRIASTIDVTEQYASKPQAPGPMSSAPNPRMESGVQSVPEASAQKSAESAPPPPPPPTTQSPADAISDADESQTSARNAMMDEDRAAMGLDALDGPTRRSWGRALGDAKRSKKVDQAVSIAQDIVKKPRALTDTETAALVIRASDIKKQHAAVLSEVAKTKDPADIRSKGEEALRLEQDFDVLTQALRAAGTETGRALAARKLTIDQDLKLLPTLARAKAAKGAELAPKERARLEEAVSKLEEMTKRAEQAERKLAEQRAERAVVRKAKDEGGRRPPQRRESDISQLMAKTRDLLSKGCR